MVERLTEECGPHCGTKDGVTGHCPACHDMTTDEDWQHHVVKQERLGVEYRV